MIIVNQSEDTIVNFKNITSLNIERVNAEYCIKCNFVNGGNITLGEYRTKERAEIILTAICKEYIMGKENNINSFYGMPED